MKSTLMKSPRVQSILLAVALLGFLAWFWRPAGGAHDEVEAGSRVVAAAFFSSFCGNCRILEPKLIEVRADYADAPVDFVTFDQTLSALNSGDIADLAKSHGVSQVYEQFKGRTGFLVLIDRTTGEVIDIVSARDDAVAIRAKLDAAIAQVGVTS